VFEFEFVLSIGVFYEIDLSASENVGMSDPPGHFLLFYKLQKGGKAYAKRSQRSIRDPLQMDSS
jgi:hypothetical protein